MTDIKKVIFYNTTSKDYGTTSKEFGKIKTDSFEIVDKVADADIIIMDAAAYSNEDIYGLDKKHVLHRPTTLGESKKVIAAIYYAQEAYRSLRERFPNKTIIVTEGTAANLLFSLSYNNIYHITKKGTNDECELAISDFDAVKYNCFRYRVPYIIIPTDKAFVPIIKTTIDFKEYGIEYYNDFHLRVPLGNELKDDNLEDNEIYTGFYNKFLNTYFIFNNIFAIKDPDFYQSLETVIILKETENE